MGAETRARIFEPFFTTKPKGKGTGLGLATVYASVGKSGGHIRVDSEPGKGTIFEVYFPRHGDEPSRSSQPSLPALADSGTETILLVEDEDLVRGTARAILRRKGYTLLEARSAGEAHVLCERHQGPIHLLLTDVVMPNMGGRELAERLSAIRPGIAVLYMSGHTSDSVLRQAVFESGVPFLQKPFTPATLARKVREVLDASRI